jgi:hypothetical protein
MIRIAQQKGRAAMPYGPSTRGVDVQPRPRGLKRVAVSIAAIVFAAGLLAARAHAQSQEQHVIVSATPTRAGP